MIVLSILYYTSMFYYITSLKDNNYSTSIIYFIHLYTYSFIYVSCKSVYTYLISPSLLSSRGKTQRERFPLYFIRAYSHPFVMPERRFARAASYAPASGVSLDNLIMCNSANEKRKVRFIFRPAGDRLLALNKC